MEKISKKEADQEAIKLFDERNKKADEIIAKAEEEGRWLPGLDSNNYLFKELDDEYKKKIKELAERIDWNR